MRVVAITVVSGALCACANHETSTSPAGPTADSGTGGYTAMPPSQDAVAPTPGEAASPSGDAGCIPAPAWPTPQVLSGEMASVVSQCGKNGNPPTLVGSEPPTNRIEIAVGFMGKAAELAMFAQEVSDPSSPLYRHYLTPAEVTARFGPSECNYQAVVDWLKAGGVSIVATYSDRFLIDANGTVAELEALLHVKLNDYLRPDGTTFYGPDRDPSVTVGPAIAISGLDDCFVSRPLLPAGDAGRD